MIEAGLCQFIRSLIQGLDELQSAVGPEEHLTGVWVKGEDHGFGLLPGRFVNHPLQEGLVPEMDPVKSARGDDAPPVGREVGESFVDQHCHKFRGAPGDL